MTRPEKYAYHSEALYLAFELSNQTWKLRMNVGFGLAERGANRFVWRPLLSRPGTPIPRC
jgi:hypothetical protein